MLAPFFTSKKTLDRLGTSQAVTDPGQNCETADKRRAVMMALEDEEWRELSDREIAKMCAVDHKTVGNIRAEIKRLSGEIPQSAELPNSLTPVYNVPIIQEYKRQINELSEKLANRTPPDTSIAVQQAIKSRGYTAWKAEDVEAYARLLEVDGR